MKSRQFKKGVSSALSFLLIVMMICSLFPQYAFAQSDTFAGIEALEVEENQKIDLLQGVTAVSPAGENLRVTVKNVICETDENYQYDDSGILNAGEVGSVYRIEYEAVSPANVEEIYSITRDVIVTSKENQSSEEAPETTPEEEREEVPDNNIDPSMGVGNQILFENGIHYIIDPEYPDKKITLFCMNNKRHWPHHTEDMGDLQVPGYTEGYLTPNDFESQEDYAECMRRMSKLLYAGYPYNGERLYQIVENSSEYAPTEEQFNEMLVVPPRLQTAYPFLGHHSFTYADWTTPNEEHLEYLRKFTGEVIKLNINDGTTSNGLTYADIASMPFYKAAFSITNCNNDTPLEAFQYFYGASYFVTEEEAYNETSKAIWHLLWEYNIPDNDIASLTKDSLSDVLYIYSERGGLLDYKPSLSDIKISGDLTFTYNPKDGMWHSSPLRLIEPEEYNGLYHLILPEGMTALCDDLSHIYGNEEYEIVSDHQPTEGEYFRIEADFVWLEQFKQYSPSPPDIEFEGKKFQSMIGAVIKYETLTANIPIASASVGDVSITKTVVGEENCQREFQFEFRLPYHQGINGLYGDLEFHKGVANFTLKDGETKKAHNLPAGAQYIVKELDTEGYYVSSIASEGTIPISDIQTVDFINTKLPDLSLGKTVTGEAGDKKQMFHFTIQLKDGAGNPVNGTYRYVGSVKNSFEQEATRPEDGEIQFTDGKGNISLSHGQQITLLDLPLNAAYTVTETDNNGYTTTYNGNTTPATGILNTDISIDVVNNKEFAPPTGIRNTNNHSTGIGVVISLSGLLVLLIACLFRWRRGWKK